MSSVRIAVENAVRDLALQTIYPGVILNKVTNQIEETALQAPNFAMVKEVGGTWGRDNRYNRTLKYARNQWSFELRMKFITEVNLEPFENLLEDGYNIKGNTYGQHGPVLVQPISSNIEHPVEQAGSAQGTSAIYLIRAETRH